MKIAIKGDTFRGKEVIQILESLGGINECLLDGSALLYYYIDYYDDKTIHCHDDIYVNKYCEKYTLEEFEKKFPFKIGDKVFHKALKDYFEIIKFDPSYDYPYQIKGKEVFNCKSEALEFYKEMKTRTINLSLDKAKEWYKKGEELREIALQAFSEKELIVLPRSWEEFCREYPVKNGEANFNSMSSIIIQKDDATVRASIRDRNICPSKKSAEAHLAMIQLEQLRNCWRQGWEPDWNDDQQTKYCIVHSKEFKIHILYETRRFLSFPTIEMAKEFLECFRDLIEKAGDLI